MYHFRASVHARPDDCPAGQTAVVAGQLLAPLAVPPERLGATMFGVSFERVTAELARLERMYVEPDGSFVWVSSRDESPWQVDGVVYDHQERVRFVDIGGSCPAAAFDRLLAVLGWPQTAVMFQLTHAAVVLGEAEFRGYAKRKGPG